MVSTSACKATLWCMCMGSNPGQPGKKFVKNDLTNLYIYIYIYIYIIYMFETCNNVRSFNISQLVHWASNSYYSTYWFGITLMARSHRWLCGLKRLCSMKCSDPEVMGLNPGRLNFGVHSPSESDLNPKYREHCRISLKLLIHIWLYTLETLQWWTVWFVGIGCDDTKYRNPFDFESIKT